jgi:peptidoglycan hydrolase CwlO-like protein
MEDRTAYRKKIEEELDQCSTRLKELKGKAKSEDLLSELEELESEVKSCKVELAEIENRSEDEWVDAKHGLARRLDSMRRSMHLSARKLI